MLLIIKKREVHDGLEEQSQNEQQSLVQLTPQRFDYFCKIVTL